MNKSSSNVAVVIETVFNAVHVIVMIITLVQIKLSENKLSSTKYFTKIRVDICHSHKQYVLVTRYILWSYDICYGHIPYTRVI